ncbi:MAG: acetate kinase, partial [Pseudomonas sp.]|nr:acetate kinase [Pseudomonas sp.]
MRDLEQIAFDENSTDPRKEDCILALNMHAYKVKKYIGAYYAALGTVDAICFTAGVGEGGCEYRQSVLEG